jgi:hypothetical protein
VVLMHPYMLHATSQNVIQHGRHQSANRLARTDALQPERVD